MCRRKKCASNDTDETQPIQIIIKKSMFAQSFLLTLLTLKLAHHSEQDHSDQTTTNKRPDFTNRNGHFFACHLIISCCVEFRPT